MVRILWQNFARSLRDHHHINVVLLPERCQIRNTIDRRVIWGIPDLYRIIRIIIIVGHLL